MVKNQNQNQNQNQSINIILLVLTIILLLLFLLIIFFYINEKNVDVQFYLKDIQYKLQKNKKTYSTITSNNRIF